MATNPPGYPWQRGQVPTAESLNAQFALCLTVPSGNLPVNSLVVGDGTGNLVALDSVGTEGQVLTSAGSEGKPTWENADIYDSSNVGITGGTIDGTTIGQTSTSSGKFTILNASGSITGNTLISTVSPGTAPLIVNSTTNVPNLNASTLSGATFSSPGTIGDISPGTASFTNLSVSSSVSGSGFTSYLAAPPAIGVSVPSTGRFTTMSATGTISPNTVAGIVGTTLADNAQAGSVGEFPTPTNLTSVALTTGVAANVSSCLLSAGDWDVDGLIRYVPAGTTVPSLIFAGVSITSATFGAPGTFTQIGSNFYAGSEQAIVAPRRRITISSPTTVYLISLSSFSVSTCTSSGYLYIRRVR